MKHAELISQMTLQEKASLLSGANFWNTKPVPRLGISGMMLTDGPHGLRKQGGKVDHLGLNKSIPATCYPSAAGLANTWTKACWKKWAAAWAGKPPAKGSAFCWARGSTSSAIPFADEILNTFPRIPSFPENWRQR